MFFEQVKQFTLTNSVPQISPSECQIGKAPMWRTHLLSTRQKQHLWAFHFSHEFHFFLHQPLAISFLTTEPFSLNLGLNATLRPSLNQTTFKPCSRNNGPATISLPTQCYQVPSSNHNELKTQQLNCDQEFWVCGA